MPVWVGIAVGGALGALARHGVNVVTASRLSAGGWASFPLSTLLVNVVGSFGLAFVLTLAMRGVVSPAWRLAIGTGFIGALTTFSTFEWEATLLLEHGAFVRGALYVLGNLALGFLAVLLGRALALALVR